MMRQSWSKFRKLAKLGVIAATLASCASLPSALRGPDDVAAAPGVEHASPDDCAIIAAVGRSELPWDATTAPTASFYVTFKTPGHETYLEDCRIHRIAATAKIAGTY